MNGSGSFIELLEEDDAIMADRSLSLDSKHTRLKLIHPPFLERKTQQLPSEKVIQTRMIARHRIHVEHCMGRIKKLEKN